ncbi:Ldh family oxidoreductase [Glycomyces endophyticus]|uniref:Ldh family oxidoreductase n=1 Tax=Glycomyces endophyticus TaxID=480996 RepID=A0ABN2HJ74_9ACTN
MAPKTVDAASLTGFATAVFTRAGLAADHAATLADVIVWASLRGVDSHGAPYIARYLDLLDSGKANAKPDIRIESTSAAVCTVDADRAPGPVALALAADEAAARARTHGIGAAAVRRTTLTGAIGYYATRIAEAGLVGIGFVAGMPNMAYPGVKGAAVATSPLAVAAPTASGPVPLLDMATATMALGRIKQYRQSGEPLPEGAAATADGVPTTDPAQAVLPLPLGGAKGAGMSLAFELLTSVLVGEPIVSAFHEGDRKHRQNALLIALDPAAFGAGDYPAAVAGTIAAVKSLPRLDESAEPRVPGDRGAASEADRRADGIPLSPKVWADLEAAADRFGVPLPSE